MQAAERADVHAIATSDALFLADSDVIAKDNCISRTDAYAGAAFIACRQINFDHAPTPYVFHADISFVISILFSAIFPYLCTIFDNNRLEGFVSVRESCRRRISQVLFHRPNNTYVLHSSV